MDQESADTINGVGVDWAAIEKLNMYKGKNTKQEALDHIFSTFYVVDEEKMPLKELIKH